MIVNFPSCNLNYYRQKNPIKHNNISFGLNEHNRKLIEQSTQNTGDRLQIIKSIDMTDPDIEPCIGLFSGFIDKNPTHSEEMNVIVDRLQECGNPDAAKGCVSHFLPVWSSLFLSTRKKASNFMDSIGIQHPPTGSLSRTATNPEFEKIANENIEAAQKYITENVKRGECPDIELLKKLHKIITHNLPFCAENGERYGNEHYSGIIENSEEDKLLLNKQYGDHSKELNRIMTWLKNHYNEYSACRLASWAYRRLLGISPFYDGNGRTIRCFIDALLYSKGYRFKEYPINYAEIRSKRVEEIEQLFEEYCEKIPDEN